MAGIACQAVDTHDRAYAKVQQQTRPDTSACRHGRSFGVIMGCAGVIMASAANFVRNVAAQTMITGQVRRGRGRDGRSGWL